MYTKLNKAVEEASQRFAEHVLKNYDEVAKIELHSDHVETEGHLDAMQLFHAEKVHMFEADDDVLFGIRADHFVVEEGTSEIYFIERGNEIINIPCFLVSANHKGVRIQKLFAEN